MATITKTKEGLVTTAQQLSAGVAKHLANATQVVFTGGTYTPAQITTTLQSIATLRADVNAAKATVRAKVAAEKANTQSAGALVKALTAHVKATYGDKPEVLADFGIVPKTPATIKAEDKAAAVVKRAATRVARHTMGSVQKKAVTGDVIGITVTPVTATGRVASAAGSTTAGAPAPAAPAAPAPRTSPTSPVTQQ